MLERGAQEVLSCESKWEVKLAKAQQDADAKKVDAEKAALDTYNSLIQSAQKNAEQLVSSSKQESDSKAKSVLSAGRSYAKNVAALSSSVEGLATGIVKTLLESVEESQ